MIIPPHITRMQTELLELNTKLGDALIAYGQQIKGDAKFPLNAEQKTLLYQQIKAMKTYAEVLASRISKDLIIAGIPDLEDVRLVN